MAMYHVFLLLSLFFFCFFVLKSFVKFHPSVLAEIAEVFRKYNFLGK